MLVPATLPSSMSYASTLPMFVGTAIGNGSPIAYCHEVSGPGCHQVAAAVAVGRCGRTTPRDTAAMVAAANKAAATYRPRATLKRLAL